MSTHKISKKGLERLKEEFPEGFDPERSYGIIPKQPRPEDTVYWLDYDPDKRYLKLNSFVIQSFQMGSNADTYFTKLFAKKGWIKKVTVKKPARAGVLVNNIKMPLKLRNAIFDFGAKGTILEVHTVIRRERARNFSVIDKEVQDYLVKCRDKHYSLVDAGKRK
ncbi:TPA: hypothetical protein EYO12_02335 [Candidatus Saccharibacteria bacterium]|nr:hypothetical protein [Candidatus Saccharibacteria bacterium]HIO87660.1 hypothetical protein [Candidatus Saccharibacteria bacterium]